MDLDAFAALAATLVGHDPAQHPALLARHGVTTAAFEAAGGRIARLSGADATRYREAFEGALRARLGGDPDLSFSAFVAANVEARAGGDMAACVRASGLPGEAHFLLASYVWGRRLEADARLAGLFEASVEVGLARRGRARPSRPAPRPARQVRALACPRCGAHKRTAARTAYIYCDYCAYLFDYDDRPFVDALGGLPFQATFARLREASLPTIRRAREAGDTAGYRAAWAWVYEQDITLLPEGYSPRVAEAGYRAGLVDFSARSCEAVSGDAEVRRAREAAEESWSRSFSRPSAKKLTAYVRAGLAALDREVACYASAGLFSLHPDALAPEEFRRIGARQLLRECLPNADAAARAAILHEADLRDEFVDVPPVDLARSSCGQCGSPLLVAEGAHRVLCESCGHVLDARAPRVPCPVCAAPFVAASGHGVECGYCHSRFESL